MSILHILNGDSTRYGFEQTGIEGDIMVWREVLSEGPVEENEFRMLCGVRRKVGLQEGELILVQIGSAGIIENCDVRATEIEAVLRMMSGYQPPELQGCR